MSVVRTNASSHAGKKRLVISYANMSPELQAAFKDRFPKGYADYMGELIKVPKPDGTFFYAVSLETEDAVYLVKIDVKVDDYEDVEKGLFEDDEDDQDGTGGDAGFPEDESVANFAGDEDSEE